MQPKMQLLKARSFSQVINNMFYFLKQNIKPLLRVMLFLNLPLLIVSSYFFSAFQATLNPLQNNGVSAFYANKWSFVVGYIGLIFSTLILGLTMLQLFLKYEESETGVIEASDIFSGIKESFMRFLGFNFMFGIFAVMGIVLFALFTTISAASGGNYLVVFIVFIGFLAFTYVTIALIFSPIIYMREREGFFDSVSRAFYLIKGHWWQTFAVITVAYIVMYMASLTFMVPYFVLAYLQKFHTLEQAGKYEVLTKIAYVFMVCAISIFSSLVFSAIMLQYYSLTEKKDGVSIMDSIENIGKETDFKDKN